jgi:hypothetical protein
MTYRHIQHLITKHQPIVEPELPSGSFSEYSLHFLKLVKDLLKDAPNYRQAGNRQNFKYAIPALAMYKTFRESSALNEDAAFSLTKKVIFKEVEQQLSSCWHMRIFLKNISRFKWFADLVVDTQTSLDEEGGWYAVAVDDGSWIAYNVTRCGIVEYMKKKHAPELVPLFCELDIFTAQHMKGLAFKRFATIADGAEVCDFRYIKEGAGL